MHREESKTSKMIIRVIKIFGLWSKGEREGDRRRERMKERVKQERDIYIM